MSNLPFKKKETMSNWKISMILFAAIIALAAAVMLLPGLGRAGNLEPPAGAVDVYGNPIPTMNTLGEIHNKLDAIYKAITKRPYEVTLDEKFLALRRDGTLGEQEGKQCGERFCDMGDGTVADCTTGLRWTKNGYMFGSLRWNEAMQVASWLCPEYCTSFPDLIHPLTDDSQPGDWRLPTADELKELCDGLMETYNITSFPERMTIGPFENVWGWGGPYWTSTPTSCPEWYWPPDDYGMWGPPPDGWPEGNVWPPECATFVVIAGCGEDTYDKVLEYGVWFVRDGL